MAAVSGTDARLRMYDSQIKRVIKLKSHLPCQTQSQLCTSSHVYPRRVLSECVRRTRHSRARRNARMFEAVLEEHAAKQARLKEDAGTSPHRA